MRRQWGMPRSAPGARVKFQPAARKRGSGTKGAEAEHRHPNTEHREGLRTKRECHRKQQPSENVMGRFGTDGADSGFSPFASRGDVRPLSIEIGNRKSPVRRARSSTLDRLNQDVTSQSHGYIRPEREKLRSKPECPNLSVGWGTICSRIRVAGCGGSIIRSKLECLKLISHLPSYLQRNRNQKPRARRWEPNRVGVSIFGT